jgi:hypothetical protein
MEGRSKAGIVSVLVGVMGAAAFLGGLSVARGRNVAKLRIPQ